MKPGIEAENEISSVRYTRYLFVVATDASNPKHHGLHTNTAPHLLTKCPQAGDTIVATIEMEVDLFLDGSGAKQAYINQRGYKLLTHAGRSAMLGEDGLEDASDNDALSEYVPEILAGAAWKYAPCEYTPEAWPYNSTSRRFTRPAGTDNWTEQKRVHKP